MNLFGKDVAIDLGTATILVYVKDKGIVYDLTGCDTFAPKYAGEYVIEYTCSDYNLTVKENYTLAEEAEISMEANPGTVTEKKLRDYRKAGINRLSFGPQSAENEELKALTG